MLKKFNMLGLIVLLVFQTMIAPVAATAQGTGIESEPVVEEITQKENSPDKKLEGNAEEVESEPSEVVEGTEGNETEEEGEVITESEPEEEPQEEPQEVDKEVIAAPKTMAPKIRLFNADAVKEIANDTNLITAVELWTNPNGDGTPQTDVSKKLSEGDLRINIEEPVSIQYTWELEPGHIYSEGDTFTFSLPDAYADALDLSDLIGKLRHVDGTEIGDWSITQSGEIKFVFNDQINDGQGYAGDFYVWRMFDESKLENSTQHEIEFDIKGNASYPIPVHFENNNPTKITKKGAAYKEDGTEPNNRNSDEIRWSVDFNLGEEVITDARFIDQFDSRLAIDLDSVKVYELEVKLDGTVGAVATDHNPSFTASASGTNGFEIDFGDINDGQAYRVEYTTKVADPYEDDPNATPNDNPTYDNHVIVQENGTPKQSETHSVMIQFNEPLNKKVAEDGYNPYSQEITWEIEYNYNQQIITAGNAVLIDTFDTTLQELVNIDNLKDNFEVYKMEINSNGEGVNGQPLDTNDYEIVSTANGFTFEFPNGIEDAYKVVYKTRAIDRIYDDQNFVENIVEIENGPKTKPIRQEIGQVIFKKNDGSINYEDKTISWEIIINQDSKTMTNVELVDQFNNQGLTFLVDTLKVNGADPGAGVLTFDDETSEFKLNFASISEPVTITYKTAFLPSYFDFEDVKASQYENNAFLDWDQNMQTDPMKKTGHATPNPLMKHNGNKTATYDATTKRITWTVNINYNQHVLIEAIFEDFYSNGQELVGDVEVYPLTIQSDGSVSPGTPKLTEGENADYILDTTVTNAAGEKGFKIDFGEIDSAYQITYQTSLEGEPVLNDGYTNNATLIDGDQPGTQFFERDFLVNPPFKGEYINKENARQKPGELTRAEWRVNINRGQSYIGEGSEIKDVISENQMYYRDSFKLYKPGVNTDGSLKTINEQNLVPASEYELEFTLNENFEESFTLTFNHSIEDAYVLTYDTLINDIHGEQISNNVTFEGHSVDNATDTDIKSHTLNFQGGAGGTVYPSGGGELKIEKVDAADTNQPLEGAVFQIYDLSGTELLEEITTNAQGIATTTTIYKYGKYVIKEKEAPEGYFIDDALESGIELDFGNDLDPFVIENTKGVWEVELTKVDADYNDIKLAGAKFKLFDSNDLEVENDDKTEFITNSDGKIILKNLEPGDYYFQETVAPEGYKITNTENIEFSITDKQISRINLGNIENEMILGSVTLTKVDSEIETILLNGAIFKVVDDSGSIVRNENNELLEGLVTKDGGVIEVTHLRPGTYSFVETQSPAHYQFDEDDPLIHEFTIGLASEDGTPSEYSGVAKNEIIKGGFTVTKTDGDSNVRLAGVVYELRSGDINGDVVSLDIDQLTTDINGEIEITGLRPGTYTLIEKEPLPGYDAHDPVEIQIEDGQLNLVEVEISKTANFLTPGSAILTKVDKDTNEPLDGAIFKVVTDISDLENAETVRNLEGTLLENLETNDNGVIRVTDLRPGTYYFVETNAPQYYKYDSTNPTIVPFTIAEADSDGNPGAVSEEAENEIIKGSVELTKVDADNNNEPITEYKAIFELRDHNGNVLQSNLETKEDGKLLVADLRPGDYQFIETDAPFGYKKDDTPIEFTIIPVEDEEDLVVVTRDVENERSTSAVELTKIDNETGETLAGAIFELRQDDIVLKEGLQTKADGTIFVDELKPGTYQFIETGAPEGYTIDETPIEFTIDFGQAATRHITTDNAIIKGDFELTKVDHDDQTLLLEGVQFALQDRDGKVIRDKLVTDADGKLPIENLRPGQYVLVETVPLFGYEGHEPITFTIDLGQLEANKITMTNKLIQGSVELTKVDTDTEEVLSGAVFDFQDSEGNVLQEGLTTNQAGKFVVENLKPGDYQFVETKAPEGYELDQTPIKFTIDKGQTEVIQIIALNEKVPVSEGEDSTDIDAVGGAGDSEGKRAPDTATNIYNLTLIGFGLMLLGLILFLARRKRIE